MTDEPASGDVLRAQLDQRPSDFPDGHVRAALAWVDGRPLDGPETSSPDDLRELRFALRSDVSVDDLRFPLQVRVPIEPLAPMHYQWLAFLGVPDAVKQFGAVQEDRFVNSLPQAELVLYFDANHNQQLDLLQPGEAGPGPDRILAVASGRDSQGLALRNVLVNRQAPNEPPLELFVEDWGSGDADGLYIVRIAVDPQMPLSQEALLRTHGITMSSTFDKYWARNMAQRDFVYTATPLQSAAPIPLFAVDKARVSWLTRGCAPYPTGRLGFSQPPPDGAAVQCGADRLSYASNPDDYCDQSDTFKRLAWQGDPDLSWWPCDERGLDPQSPYVPASKPLGTSVLSLWTSKAYTGIAFYEPPTDFHCRADVIYDFDEDPKTHLPAIAPPAGSQVMCYGHDALSFVPDDAECLRKFTYELSSDQIPGYAQDDAMQWDLRDAPPQWWPCDAQGELIADSPYSAPKPLADPAPCPDVPAVAAPGGDYPPPPHTKIRCTSSDSLIAVPLWSDHCDGRSEIALHGGPQKTPRETSGWEQDAPAGWPCDENGSFMPTRGYEAL